MQQVDKDQSSRWFVWLHWTVSVPVGSGADSLLP